MCNESWQRMTRYVSALAIVLTAAALTACRNTRTGPEATRQEPATKAAPQNARSEPSAAPAKTSSDDGFNPAEHPEFQQADGQPQRPPVSTDSLASAITTYVQNEAARNGGFFIVPDPEQKTSLALTLARVHRDRLSRLKDGRYFACADFKGRDGHVYDVDVFMQDGGKGLNATDVTVHKKDGCARYNWVEDNNGVWKREDIPGK